MSDLKINGDVTTKIITLLEGLDEEMRELKSNNDILNNKINEINISMARDSSIKEKVEVHDQYIGRLKEVVTVKDLCGTLKTVKEHTEIINTMTGSWKTIAIIGGMITFGLSVMSFFN